MNSSEDRGTQTEKRVLEDTLGATIGAAVGAGVTTILGLVALPIIAPLVPIGLVSGSIVGVVLKELLQRHRAKEGTSLTTKT